MTNDNKAFDDIQDICLYLMEMLDFIIKNEAVEILMKTRPGNPLDNVVEECSRTLCIHSFVKYGKYAGYEVSLDFNILRPDAEDADNCKDPFTIQ